MFLWSIHTWTPEFLYPKTEISNLGKTVKNRNRKICKMKNLRKPKPYSTSLKKPKPENFETEPALVIMLDWLMGSKFLGLHKTFLKAPQDLILKAYPLFLSRTRGTSKLQTINIGESKCCKIALFAILGALNFVKLIISTFKKWKNS